MKQLIIIGGPTASGKTNLAIRIADFFQTEIISSDSRQLYKELSIGTAKPDQQQLSAVKHHFINHISINDEYNASLYAKEAAQLLNRLFEHTEILVLTGGSGLYVSALLHGLSDLPSGDLSIRSKLSRIIKEGGIEQLQDEIRIKDPVYAASSDTDNPQRLIRALEVIYITGRPFSSFLGNPSSPLSYPYIYYCLNPSRELLYSKINQRVDEMINRGLIEEVKSLIAFRHHNALNTVGYKEIFNHLDGLFTVDKAIELIKQHTRNYAKRQLTWYRKINGIRFIDPLTAFNTICSEIKKP